MNKDAANKVLSYPAWVSCDWLNDHLADTDLVILDATLDYMPNGSKVPEPEQKIKGARRFNFDTEICQPNTDLPHMMPSADAFQQAARALGINKNSNIIIYDAMGIFSSPRAWWMFKVMGHQQVSILSGGLPAWTKKNLPIQSSYSQSEIRGDFTADYAQQNVLSKQDILDRISADNNTAMIIDARSYARFSGEQAEPREGLAKGHIPGSVCLPFDSLIENGEFRNDDELKSAFEKMKIATSQKEIVYSCGSGVTACVLAIAGYHLGLTDFKIYDGSWAEWGADSGLPVSTGAD